MRLNFLLKYALFVGAIVTLCLVFAFSLRAMLAKKPETPFVRIDVSKNPPIENPNHGYLGITFASVETTPLTIQSVTPGTGAAEAGLKPGDQLLAAGPAKALNYAALQAVLNNQMPGVELPLTIRRGEEELEVKVKLISFTEMGRLRSEEERRESRP